jgi:hypothetical protein
MKLLILTDSARKEPEQLTPDMAAVSGTASLTLELLTAGTVHRHIRRGADKSLALPISYFKHNQKNFFWMG